MSLKMPVTTPMSKDDPSDVKTEFIPLPPRELWPELDNSAAKAPQAAPSTPTATPADTSAALQFLGDTRSKEIPLECPFVLDGVEVLKITVRRLTLGEVEGLLALNAGRRLTTMDIYAVMTGFPVSVIRGLDDEDGIAVTEAAYNFLPRRLRPESASSDSSTVGEATLPA